MYLCATRSPKQLKTQQPFPCKRARALLVHPLFVALQCTLTSLCCPSFIRQTAPLYVPTFSVTISTNAIPGNTLTTDSAPLCPYAGSAAVRAHFFCHHFRQCAHNRQRSPLFLCRQCSCTCTLFLSPFQAMLTQHTSLPSVLMQAVLLYVHYFCHKLRLCAHNTQRSPLFLCRQCCCTCTLFLSPFQETHSQQTALPSALM
jgi:hypothetical protein